MYVIKHNESDENGTICFKNYPFNFGEDRRVEAGKNRRTCQLWRFGVKFWRNVVKKVIRLWRLWIFGVDLRKTLNKVTYI